MSTTDDQHASRPAGRKRSKLACEPCRELKRKCDGSQPCGACLRFEYNCVYQKAAGKRKRAADQSSDHPGAGANSSQPPAASRPESWSPMNGRTAPAPSTGNGLRSLEANSGAAFLRRLALRLDPKNAPRMHTFAWNAFLGSRQMSHAPTTRSVTDILSRAEMEGLAAIYFDKIDPVYGFVDRQHILGLIGRRWSGLATEKTEDAILCGIASLGCLFSQVQPSSAELDLLESARSELEQRISDIPSAAMITAWLFRVIYLRVAGTHHAAWMASCIVMHMLEAAGFHCDSPGASVIPMPSEPVDPEIQWRLVAVAQHLNIWMSFDMGRSRVSFWNATMAVPSARDGDKTGELMELLPYSAELDPQKTPEPADLTAALSAVLDRVHTSPPSTLAQCNLALCLCRRLQSTNASFTPALMERILAITAKGIKAAQAILDARSPWHHMANVPFQIVCVLLAFDTLSSIAQLKDAMQCLSNVAAIYKTDATREALTTASLLIMLQQKCKEKGASELEKISKLFPILPDEAASDEPLAWKPEDTSWLDSITGEFYSLDYSDIDQILFPTHS
ncbi:glutaredoxin Grx1 [Purpureocillium lavendulum]|uniref:Glutaredoxin Grx1 n=1 Tax=Purpureocillium lavendulum TaxID=1247861 RepID=A0AB34FJB9_9HYPO|nr:glutaredoxin Grx1 [Purpureocillium lavendulum]